MKMKLFLILACASQAAQAAPIQPNLNLSNFQATTDLSFSDGFFGGFNFSTVLYGAESNGKIPAYLTLGNTSWLSSTPVAAEHIRATASVDFTIEGYRVSSMSLFGYATDDGSTVSETVRILSPCAMFMTGSDSSGVRGCALSLESGTISASLDMRTDQLIRIPLPNGGFTYYSDTGRVVTTLQLTLEPIHNPEPGMFTMIGLGLVVLSVMLRKAKKD